METKNKIVRYSESFRTDSEIKEPWHYKSMERIIDGVYVVPKVYIPFHRSFGQRITKKEAEAVCAEYGLNFPSSEEIEMLEVAYDAAQSRLPEIAEYTDCWTSDVSTTDESARKFLILFCYEAGSVKQIKHHYVLIDEKQLYQYLLGVWLRPSPELLLGDKFSNLFQTRDHDLFLQKEQKLSYIGRCKEIWYDEIILSSTGLYQYTDGEMRCLVKVNESREEYNNSNYGYQEWVILEGIMPDGEIVCTFKTYNWCDDGEQTSESAIEKRFRKDEQGLYQPCK